MTAEDKRLHLLTLGEVDFGIHHYLARMGALENPGPEYWAVLDRERAEPGHAVLPEWCCLASPSTMPDWGVTETDLAAMNEREQLFLAWPNYHHYFTHPRTVPFHTADGPAKMRELARQMWAGPKCECSRPAVPPERKIARLLPTGAEHSTFAPVQLPGVPDDLIGFTLQVRAKQLLRCVRKRLTAA